MQVKINKFMELRDVEFSTPCEISGKNGIGKTTLLRAMLYVLSGKDLDGTTFYENVYPFNPKTASECFADVTIILEGRTFRKETNGKEVRAAGEVESKIIKSINTKYYVDGQIVDKTSFEGEIKKYTAGKDFQLFVNPNHFAGLKVDEKRAIFAEFFDFKTFNSDIDVNTLRQALKNTKQKESELIANIKAYKAAEKPEPVADERKVFECQISELETQVKGNSFSLQPDEIAKNNEIAEKINKLKLENYPVFVPAAKLIKSPLQDLLSSDVQKSVLKRLMESEFDSSVLEFQIATAKKELDNYNSLISQIENFEAENAGAKCNVCTICTLDLCPQKKTDSRSLEDLTFEFSLLEEKNWAEIIENFQSNLILKKSEFESKKQADIAQRQKAIQDVDARNSEIEAENLQIIAENDKIDLQNAEIDKQNSTAYAAYQSDKSKFETEKSEKIKALEASIIIPKQSDNSEKYDKIAELKKQLAIHQFELDDYNKKSGFYENSIIRAGELEKELALLRIDLSAKEREEILYKDAELTFYTELQEKINQVLPSGFSLKLFEKNKSNDNITLIFDLLFNENLYFSNGQKAVAFAQLCKLFQTKSGVNFPIFVDESSILDEKNREVILSLQNIIIVRKSEESLTIKSL